MRYDPVHFKLYELVPPKIYKHYGNNSIWFLSPVGLMMIDGIHKFFHHKKITINNWYWGGNFALRGFRPPDTDIGSKLSQHKFGRGFDMTIEGVPADVARQAILDNQDMPDLQYITVMEDKVTWLHCDCRNTNSDSIILVNP